MRTLYYLTLTILSKLSVDLLVRYQILNPRRISRHFNEDGEVELEIGGYVYIFFLIMFVFSLVRLIINGYRLVNKIIHVIKLHMRTEETVYARGGHQRRNTTVFS